MMLYKNNEALAANNQALMLDPSDENFQGWKTSILRALGRAT
jgi:hypothetical protein